jgi:hypothetical protein
VFVVQLAAFLDRLTLRRIIALIPVVLFFLAYAHRIPVPPELMLVGDFVAYIDVFSALLVLGLLSRAATIFFIVKETTGTCRQTRKWPRGAVATNGLPAPSRRRGEEPETVDRASRGR